MSPVLCHFEAPTLLFFSSNVPSFVYFTHFPVLFFSVLLSLYVLRQGAGKLPHHIFFWSLLPFSLWIFFNLVVWASNRSDLIMFLWSLQIVLEPITYAGLFYLLHVIATGRDLPYYGKVSMLAAFIPLFVITPTQFLLPAFNVTYCIPEESIWSYYSYVLELLFVLLIIVQGVRYYRGAKDKALKSQIAYLTIGIFFFLATFSSGNIIGSFTENWNLAQIGLFGTPIFLGIIAYLIARFQLFDIRIVGAEMLVVSVWAVIFSTLFVQTIENIHDILFVALALVTVVGFFLVRSVRREVRTRHEIEEMASYLAKANARLRELDKQKTEFVSIASHQLRSPLTAITGYSSLILEGSFGPVSDPVRGSVDKIYQSGKLMAIAIDDFLNVTRIEQGRMQYDMSSFNICDIVQKTVDDLRFIAKEKGLELIFEPQKSGVQYVYADQGKVKQVITNLIDNAIKYTPQGYVKVFVKAIPNESKVHVYVEDTGIGLSKDAQQKLFQKFSRAENANKTNVHGTGLGLYLAQSLMKAQGGRIYIESAGEGTGSTFIIEFRAATLEEVSKGEHTEAKASLS